MSSVRSFALALLVPLLLVLGVADAPARVADAPIHRGYAVTRVRTHRRCKPTRHKRCRRRHRTKHNVRVPAPTVTKRPVRKPVPVAKPAPVHTSPKPPAQPKPAPVPPPVKSKPAPVPTPPAPPPPAPPAARPVMLSAEDQDYWPDGEKVVTVWSAPVNPAGPDGADSFVMTAADGTPVSGDTVSSGSAPDQIVIDLPSGSESPTTITYTGNGGTVVVDGSGRAAAASPSAVSVAQTGATFAGTLTDPFSRTQMLPFGARSFWLQPWRSYQDTWPATRMLNAVGINFNVLGGHTDEVDAAARLLHDAGFTHARIEVGWDSMSYSDPGQFANATALTNKLQQLEANGIRPLILLNSNDQIPCPVQRVTLNLTAPAAAGATTVTLDSASSALVKPGLTGFAQFGREGGVLITSVDSNGVAQLSRPLQTALPAGSQTAFDLAFQPFFPQYNPDGTPNANNQATLAGWLQYVAGVTQTVKQTLGNDNFDVEIWNELSFGSAFLDAGNYYASAPQGSGSVKSEILQATVNYIRDPANGLTDVGIGNGFANEQPFAAGTNQVPGMTAIDKHPYSGLRQYSTAAGFSGNRPWDALGEPAGTKNASGWWVDSFVPTFTELMPEHFLTALQTETVTRDLAPFTSTIYGTLHGRTTSPDGGTPPQMWVTEVNMSPGAVKHTLTSPDGTQTSPMSAADVSHFDTKAVLRYLTSFVGKGVTQIDFFAAADAGDLDVITPSFFTAADAMHGYPGLSAGGGTVNAVRRYLDAMSGAESLSQVTPINLESISDYDGGYQFRGNGTAQYPTLYNRDMINFDPFQVTPHKWVIPTYVTTLDLATLYNPNAPSTDVTRQDLPQEVFSFTLSGVNPNTAAVSATDPVTGSSVPVRITARDSSSVTVEIPLTDYPRMLTLTDS
jgi:hypothetical protein